jgi:mono/diheme cytochrome c family protein
MIRKKSAIGLMLAAASLWSWLHASAQDMASGPTVSPGDHFTEQAGESLYRATCQDCHMSDGRGAEGAGHFPALANNPRVGAAPYIVNNVLHGHRGMPPFGDMLSDEQVAAVVNYTRTHFGNHYEEPVSATDVRNLR